MSVLADYSLNFSVKGSKIAVKEMEKLLKTMDTFDKKTLKEVGNTEKETEAFQKQEKQINKNNVALWTLGRRLLTLGAVFGLLKKSWSLGINFAQEGQNIKYMSNSANMATKEFQKWSYVAKRYGGTEGSILSTMQNLDMQIEQAKYGQVPMQEVAARYGITLPSGGSAEDFLKTVAKKMESMDTRSQLAMGRAFGFDEATIRILQLGLNGLNQELKKAESKIAFSSEQIQRADEFNKKLIESKQLIYNLSITLGDKFLPVFNQLVGGIDKFVEYMQKRGIDNIKNFFMPLIELVKLLSASQVAIEVGEKLGEFIFFLVSSLEKIANLKSDFLEKIGGFIFSGLNPLSNPEERKQFENIKRDKLIKAENEGKKVLSWLEESYQLSKDIVNSSVSLAVPSAISTITGGIANINNDNKITINAGSEKSAGIADNVVKTLEKWTTSTQLRDAALDFVSPEK